MPDSFVQDVLDGISGASVVLEEGHLPRLTSIWCVGYALSSVPRFRVDAELPIQFLEVSPLLGDAVCLVCHDQVIDGLHRFLLRGEAGAELAKVNAPVDPLGLWAFPEAFPRSKALRGTDLAPVAVGPKTSLRSVVLGARNAVVKKGVATIPVVTAKTWV